MPNQKISPERTGAVPPDPTSAVPVFPYVLRWDRKGRKGQFCRKININGQHTCIEFQDGTRMVVSVSAIVRRPEYRDSLKVVNSVKEGGRGESPEPLVGLSAGSPSVISSIAESGSPVR